MGQYIELCGLFLFREYFMSLCSYTEKNLVCANLYQVTGEVEREEEPKQNL